MATRNQSRYLMGTITVTFMKKISRSHIPAAKSRLMINECEGSIMSLQLQKQSVVVSFNTANSYHHR
jgi:hypothetical protein